VSSERTKYVLVGLSVLALVLALVLAAVAMFRRASSEAAGDRDDIRYPFYCTECKRVFARYGSTLPAAPGPLWADTIKPVRVDCPKCGAKDSAVLMIPCPNCGNFYVPPSAAAASQPAARAPRDICPYCGTDRRQWIREHPELVPK